jgi:hypothetical protein
MSLRKRGGIWWVDVVAPNGERIRRTAGTANKALAQEYHDRLKADLWRLAKLGERPRKTWNDAVVRWLKEHAHKATAKEDVTKLRWLDQFLGGKDLEHVRRALVDRITDAKLAQGCSNATVNRTLELLRAILRKCVNDWEWLNRAPSVRMLKEPTRRIRFPDPRRRAPTPGRVTGASGRHGGVLARDGLKGFQRHRSAVVASGLDAAVGVDSPRSGKGWDCDSGPAECGGRGAHQQTGREALDARVQLSG